MVTTIIVLFSAASFNLDGAIQCASTSVIPAPLQVQNFKVRLYYQQNKTEFKIKKKCHKKFNYGITQIELSNLF
jgi:hypothetical protein